MNIKEVLQNWVDEYFEGGSLFLIDIEKPENKNRITVLVDGDSGVDIGTCASLSRHLSRKLEEADYGDHPYTLEVSSPGVDRPLKVYRQYAQHQGRHLEVKTAEGVLSGKLREISDDTLTIMVPVKNKKLNEKREIPFSQIIESKVLTKF